MPSVATAIDIARLYEELRECVRANDQEGVKRVFGELVAARRPVAEILGEVKSLTKEREEAEAEAKAAAEAKAKSSFTREWPVATASSQTWQSAPAQPYRDFGAASEPPPAPPQRSVAAAVAPPRVEEAPSPPAPPLWRQPPAATTPPVIDPPRSAPEMPGASEPLSDPEPPEVASIEPQATTTPTPQSQPEPLTARAPDWFSPVAPVTEQESDAARQDRARSIAFESPPASNSVVVTPPITSPPEQAQAPVEAPATVEAAPATVEEAPAASDPAVAETPMPEPSRVDLREIIRSASGVAAEPASETRPISPAIDHAVAQSAPAAPDRNESEAAPMPRRAASLGIALDAPPATVQTEPPARQMPIAAIAIAAVGIIALAGGGWFVLSPRAPEPTASTAMPAKEAAPAADAAAPAKETPLVEKLRAAQPAPGKTPATSTAAGGPPKPPPPPTPPSAPTTTPQNLAVPDPTSAPKLEAAPGLAKPETPKEAAPAAATPDTSAPAEASKSTASSEARLSATETEALLSRGDAAFGVGDIASARLFYERAADAGNGEAALRLGESYDPNFLERVKLRAIKGDPKAAAVWYRRAKELGVAEADILLKGIQTK